MNRVEELTLKLADGAITDAERAELDEIVARDAEAARTYLCLLEQEGLLKGGRVHRPVFAEEIVDAIREETASRVENGVVSDIVVRRHRRAKPLSYANLKEKALEPAIRLPKSIIFRRAAAILIFLVVAGFFSTTVHVATLEASPQEAFVFGQWEVTPGARSSYRVYIRDGRTSEPIEGAEVVVRLESGNGESVWEAASKTDANGIATAEPVIPFERPDAHYILKVEAESEKGDSSISQQVKVSRDFKVLVTTDKPLYQPGQAIHIRSLALASSDMRPVAGREVVFEVSDGRGNKVFKKKMESSEYGIASADFTLAEEVNLGNYSIAATIGDTRSERTVVVDRYSLPRFKIDVETDKKFYRPGHGLTGDLHAEYTFGKPVAGADVLIKAYAVPGRTDRFAEIVGTTDGNGDYSFEFVLSNDFGTRAVKNGEAYLALEVIITDSADHRVTAHARRTVCSEAIIIDVLPESGTAVPGVENILYLLTSYPDGRPAKATLTVGSSDERVETSELGIAKVFYTPPRHREALTITASDTAGNKGKFSTYLETASSDILLRPDRAVYDIGDTMEAEVFVSRGADRAFLDVVKDRRTVLTRAIDIADGRGRAAIDLPTDLSGTLEVHAYYLSDAAVASFDTRVVQVRRPADGLEVSARLDKESYRPGEKALLKFFVKRRNGRAVPAALGISGVDEAVFALSEMRPGLEAVYFALQEELIKPRYEIRGTMPVTANMAVNTETVFTPGVREATVALYSTADGMTRPQRMMSKSLPEKAADVEGRKNRYYSNIIKTGLWLPFTLFFILILPLFIYAVHRYKNATILETIPHQDRLDLSRIARLIFIVWIAGFYLPLALLTFGGLFEFFLVGVLCFGGLAVAVISFRAIRSSQELLFLRKVVTLLPFAYFVAMLAVCSFFAASNKEHNIEDTSRYLLLIPALALLYATSVGAMAVSFCVWRKPLTVREWNKRVVGYPALVIMVPVVLFLLIFVLGPLSRLRNMSMPMALEGDAGFATSILRSAPESKVSLEKLHDEFDNDIYNYYHDDPTKNGRYIAPSRVRRYFPETLLWNPELITDSNGEASIEIDLADSITTWRIAASAVSGSGELGATSAPLKVFQEFFVDIDFPGALTMGDRVSVPVAIFNYLDVPQKIKLELSPSPAFRLFGEAERVVEVAAGEVTSVPFTIEALELGSHSVTVTAYGTESADAVERKVKVLPLGAPRVETIGGVLARDNAHSFEIPMNRVEGAEDLAVKIYPGPVSEFLEGMQNIFRMPGGCFEQTTSTAYPNVMALLYLRENGKLAPEVEKKAFECVSSGYQRQLTFEVPGGGFSYYGKEPALTPLTAYGLMAFCDTNKVYEVDPALIARTRNWLFRQQDREGSWNNDFASTAYISWAVAETGEDVHSLWNALDYLRRRLSSVSDPYYLALAAAAFSAAGDEVEASGILDRLSETAPGGEETAYWESRVQGVTHSYGASLNAETTALAAYVMLRTGYDPLLARKALRWLSENRDSRGTWHSTQATVHALRALAAGMTAGGAGADSANVSIYVNGKMARQIVIDADTSDVLRLVSLKEHVRQGANSVRIVSDSETTLAYQVVATHYLPWSARKGPAPGILSIAQLYDRLSLKTGDVLTARVTVRYDRAGTARMTIVELGLPPGFEVLPGEFKKLVDENVIEKYESAGDRVILYFDSIHRGVPVTFEYAMRAKFPVAAATPAATVYQYYEPELYDRSVPVNIVVE